MSRLAFILILISIYNTLLAADLIFFSITMHERRRGDAPVKIMWKSD